MTMQLKLGPEVEGRLAGIQSMFVDLTYVFSADGRQFIDNSLLLDNVKQVYFSCNTLNHSSVDWSSLDMEYIRKLHNTYELTFELDSVEQHAILTTMLNSAQLDYNVMFNCKDLSSVYAIYKALREDDQIKFVSSELNVLVIKVSDVMHTHNTAFLQDQVIDFRSTNG